MEELQISLTQVVKTVKESIALEHVVEPLFEAAQFLEDTANVFGFGSALKYFENNLKVAVLQVLYLVEISWDVLQMIWERKGTRRMSYFLVLNLVVMFAEYYVGETHNSVGLLSDATHMLNDNMALVIGIVASAISR